MITLEYLIKQRAMTLTCRERKLYLNPNSQKFTVAYIAMPFLDPLYEGDDLETAVDWLEGIREGFN